MPESREGFLIPPKLCAWCRLPFTPRKPEQRYCPKPSRCAYQAQSRLRRGQVPHAAVEGKRKRDAAIRDARLGGRFGALSEREQQVFDYAYQLGYDDGYQTAYAPLRKQSA